MESLPVSWTWMVPSDQDRLEAAAAEELPQQGCIDADALARLLQEPANDQVRFVLIRGWHPLVVAALISDAVLAGKTWIWLGSPVELRALARDLALAGPAAPGVIVRVVEDPSDLVTVVASFPVPCPVIDLSGSKDALEELRSKQRQALMRVNLTARRSLHDLGHLLARRARPLPCISLAGLAGIHAGRTAVCIAAGPSQDRALQRIREFLPDCLVFCVDIVHRRLTEQGQRVDYVVNLDSDIGVARRIGGCPDDRTVLVMPIAGHREMEASFHRVSYLFTRHAAFEGDYPADHFWHGSNVGCGIIGLAIHLGCTEVLLVGHDLSFTADSYYAGSVAEKDTLQQVALHASAPRVLEIPGNAGGMVRSNMQFAGGVDDIWYLLQKNPQVRAWNLAANFGVGAAIPGAGALPEDWRPGLRGTGLTAPELPGTVIPRLDPQAVLAECRATAAAWHEQRSRGLPIRDVMVTLEARGELRNACQMLTPFINGYMVDALRLMALPASADCAPVIAEVERCCDRTVGLWLERVERAMATDDWMPAPKREWSDPAQRAWLGALLGWRIMQSAASSQSLYLHFAAREYSELLQILPQAPLPHWRDLSDWVIMANALWAVAPASFITTFVDLCELQGDNTVKAAAAQARTLGLAGEAPSPEVAACRRLHRHLSTDPWADALLATTWLSLIPLTVNALLAKGEDAAGRLGVLERLIRDGRIPVGDVLVGKVVAAHPDIAAVCALFEGHEKVMGEATTLAMAQRLAGIGDVDGAITNLVRIRALSGHALDAWRLLCRLLNTRLGTERMLAEMRGMWPQGQAALAIFEALGDAQGPGTALLIVEGWRTGALPVEVLATMAQAVITALGTLPPAAADSLRRMLDEAEAQPGVDRERIAEARTLLARAAGASPQQAMITS